MIEHRGWLVVLEQLLFRSYCSCNHHHLADVGTRKYRKREKESNLYGFKGFK